MDNQMNMIGLAVCVIGFSEIISNYFNSVLEQYI